MALEGTEPEEFELALLDAYRSRSTLERMFYFRLKKSLSAIAADDISLADIIFQLIVTAEAQGWIERLVIAAYEYNPGNELLKRFYQSYGLKHGITTTLPPSKNSSQEVLQPHNSDPVESKRKISNTKTTKRSHPTETYDSVSSGPDKFLAQANKYLKKAQQCTQKGVSLFQAMNKNGFTSAQYKETLELPKQLHEHLDNLYELVEITSPFPDIGILNHQQNISKRQLISKIELIAEYIANELVPSLDNGDLPFKDIEENFEQLKQMLDELYPLFQVGSLPAQVRVMKPDNSRMYKTGKPVRKNNHTL